MFPDPPAAFQERVESELAEAERRAREILQDAGLVPGEIVDGVEVGTSARRTQQGTNSRAEGGVCEYLVQK